VVVAAAVLALAASFLAGCSKTTMVTGTVTYRERIALTPEAVVTVKLQDVSLADAAAVTVGEQTITNPGQVPIPFEIEYDAADIDERFTYAVRAEIRDQGRLMFTTATHYGVITRDNPTEVEIILERVGEEVAAGDLEDAVWVLESYGERGDLKAVLDATEITAEFKSEDGQVGGSAGCNRYFGDYELDGGSLSVGLLASTAMACPEAIMEQEQAYIEALQAAESYRVEGDELRIDGGGLELVFRRQSSEDTGGPVRATFTFDQDTQGWVGGFADLPVDHEEHGYSVGFSHSDIPVEGKESKGLFLTGNNHSDDLFLYVMRRFGPEDGVTPGGTYQIDLSFQMATEVPPGMMGIGGSPGESVYIKAGVVDTEPKSVEQAGNYEMNIDKGQQSNGGEDMIVVGDAAKGEGEGQEDDSFRYKPFEHTFQATADENGQLWVIIGADSGFEGISRLYFDDISVTFTPME
jgi:uncharacterized lipoprotein YbaY